jgi:hypothetical protein
MLLFLDVKKTDDSATWKDKVQDNHQAVGAGTTSVS